MKLSRLVVIQGNASKRKIIGFGLHIKKSSNSEKDGKYSESNNKESLPYAKKKENKSMSWKWVVWLPLDRSWEFSVRYWRHSYLPVIKPKRIRRYNKKASCLGSFQCVNENCALLKYCGKQNRLHLNKTNQACSVCVKEGDYNACPAIKMGVSWWLVSRLNTPQWLSYLWSKEALQANRGSEQEIMSRQVYRHKSNWRCDYWYFKRGQTFLPKCISYCRLHPRRRDALLCKAENQQYGHSLEAGPALRSKHLARDPCCIFQLN